MNDKLSTDDKTEGLDKLYADMEEANMDAFIRAAQSVKPQPVEKVKPNANPKPKR